MPFDLPAHSPLLPAFRQPEAVVARLQVRHQRLAESGDLTHAARMVCRAQRVVMWKQVAHVARAPMPPKAQVRKAEPDPLDALIAQLRF